MKAVIVYSGKGDVVLFPDEIMPVDMDLLQQQINEGYIMLSDGRYLPPKEIVEQCFNAYGHISVKIITRKWSSLIDNSVDMSK